MHVQHREPDRPDVGLSIDPVMNRSATDSGLEVLLQKVRMA